MDGLVKMPALYMPIATPPTPAPSPGPSDSRPSLNSNPARLSRLEFASLNANARLTFLASLLADCTPSELLYISTTITPLLKRDFLYDLPPEIALHILEYVDDPKTLARVGRVSKQWRKLHQDDWLWKSMCERLGFPTRADEQSRVEEDSDEPLEELERFAPLPLDPALEWITARKKQARREQKQKISLGLSAPTLAFSYHRHFKYSYTTMQNFIRGGKLLRTHLLPPSQPLPSTSPNQTHAATNDISQAGVVTSTALDGDWLVVGLANAKIHIFSARTGVLARTLVGHDSGVWAVSLVKKGGGEDSEQGDDGVAEEDDATETLEHTVPKSLRIALGLDKPRRRVGSQSTMGKKSDSCGASDGWGQPNALVVSAGCDRTLKVWDVKTGYCIYSLPGHTSTIRCTQVLHGRPIAVTGSRDSTLRVWNIQRGAMLRVLQGHIGSVRCLDVCGNIVVSGSYDTTCRVWNVDTGECVHVLRGHYHQIYSVAFDGIRIASGGLDTTVRIWDPQSGQCLALLQGHTALVCQLQLSNSLLCTGGSDGRVITFSLPTPSSSISDSHDALSTNQPYTILHRLAAHDSSVTALQFSSRFLVTAGIDGRVRLFETATGKYVRDLCDESESVWKVAVGWDEGVCAVLMKRAGRTVLEVWSFRGEDGV